MPMPRSAAATALALLASLAACNTKPGDSTDALDNELVNGIGSADADPALSGALGNQIVVDPSSTRGAKPAGPRGAGETLGDRAKAQSAAAQNCDFKYDAAWAGKLPAPLAVYPGAKVAEAAGSDAAGCRRRIVSFTTSAPAAQVLEHYRARVTAAGYSAEHLVENGREILGGTRGDSAYYLTVAPAKGGSSVDLVAN